MMVCDLAKGLGLREALEAAMEELRCQQDHEETLEALEAVLEHVDFGTPVHRALQSLGEGWIAEEALALAVFCALKAPSLEAGIIMAVNITGDSDSTGAITGNLLGAHFGVHEIPERWLDLLELKPVITDMADDLASVPSWVLQGASQADTDERVYWTTRYPGT